VAEDPAPPSSVPPKVLESVRRHFGVPDGVLDVLVAEVVLQGPRVVAIVDELEPAGMAKRTAERMPSTLRCDPQRRPTDCEGAGASGGLTHLATRLTLEAGGQRGLSAWRPSPFLDRVEARE